MSSRIEADIIMLYIYHKIRMRDTQTPVVIDAEDTDVVVASAYSTTILPGTLGLKRKKSIFNGKELASVEMANIIVRFHIMTGCDSISSFFSEGTYISLLYVIHDFLCIPIFSK